ncbi:MAG: insulinase family protein [Anaerolineae bacterium]|nr:insulinase family protein [Anaerolineae bacterium]
MVLTTRRHVLPNGLTVIVRPSRAVPIVSSWLWYRVGSRNEPSGMTGAAHWVEHMMFKGTPKYPRGQLDRLVARNGGAFNAFTHTDYTCYFETLPAERLDLALDIESDRMVNASFEPSEVESERTVVISEREGLENTPEFLLSEEVTAAAFKVHPYHHEVIGWKADLESMTRDQLYGLYRRYYSPGNAVLVLVGDLDEDRTLRRVEETFGAIPAGETVSDRIPPEPRQRGERRVKVRQAGPTSYLQVAYHVPAATDADAPALIVLDAVLSGAKPMSLMRPSGGSRSARLYRALVETEWATSATSTFSLTADPGLFALEVTARPERRADEVEEVLLREVDRLLELGVSDEEVLKARKQTRAQLAYSLESVANQAYWLGFFEMLESYERFERFEEALSEVTPDQVREVARQYLTEDNRTVGHFIPTNSCGTVGMAPQTQSRRSWPHVAFLRAPEEAQPPMGPETVLRREMDNGAVVLAYRKAAAPSVVALAQVKAGAVLDPPDKRGLAAFTGSMLERGTENRTFQEVNEELDAVGASLRVAAAGHTAGMVGKSLAEDAGLLFDVMADVMRHPAFPQSEFRKLQGEIIADLREMDDDTGYVASQRFRELLYPADHPYHYRTAGYVDTIGAMTREDLLAFYQRYYDPRNLTLIVVGALEPEQAFDAVVARFADWRPSGELVTWSLPPVGNPGPAHDAVAMPDKTQTDIVWGFLGLERTNPRYYAAHLLDVVWGQLGLMGRLGERIREQMGLAYYVYSRLDAGFGPGPWSVRAGVNPANVERALEAIHSEAHAIVSEPVTQEELADVKAFLTGSMPMRLETNEGLATALASIESFGLGLDYVQRYPDIVNAVTAEEMLEVGRMYIRPHAATWAMAGPAVSVRGGG